MNALAPRNATEYHIARCRSLLKDVACTEDAQHAIGRLTRAVEALADAVEMNELRRQAEEERKQMNQ